MRSPTLAVMKRLALVLAIASSGLSPAFASDGTVLGRDGQVYELVVGSLADLLGAQGLASDNQALALECTRADGSRELLLVPGTDDQAVEVPAGLVYFEPTATAFALFVRQVNGIHSQLAITAYRADEGWSETLTLAGNSFSSKLAPQLVITRDLVGDGDEALNRTVAHVVWREDTSGVLYTPVLMVENSFELMTTPLYRLDGMFEGDDELRAAIGEAELEIQPGVDRRSVMIGFSLPSQHKLEAVEVRLLPDGLVTLASAGHDFVSSSTGGDLPSLADDVRAHIINIGRGLHRELVGALATKAKDIVLGASPGSDLGALADDVRAHIINIGAKMDRDGLSPRAAGQTRLARIETSEDSGRVRSHYLELREGYRHELPAGFAAPEFVFFSPDGANVILAWSRNDGLVYREHSATSADWAEEQSLSATGRSLEQLLRLLEQRVRSQ